MFHPLPIPGPWTVLGLMAGTSADGADAALIRVDPAGFEAGSPFLECLGHHHEPYPPGLRRAVLAAAADRLKPSGVCVLQRKLGEHGTTHLEIVDSVRSEMSSQLVEKGHLSLTEIAFLVGFTDVSGFQRAYKRWTGTSPSDVRARARAGAPRA